MELGQKVAFNTLVQILAKIVTVVFGIITTVLLTRYLGKTDFGDYIFVLTYVMIFGAVADWGTALIGVREASGNQGKEKEILSNIIVLRFALSIMAAIAAVVLINVIPLRVYGETFVKEAVFVGSLLVVLFATKASFGIVFQTKLKLEKLAAVDIVIGAITFVMSLVIIGQGGRLTPLILAIVIANIIGVVIAGFQVNKIISINLKPNWKLIGDIGKEAVPMGAVLVVFSIYNKIDTVMLAVMKGSEAVGIYGVAYRVYDIVILGAAYFMQAMLPVLSQYGKNFNQNSNFIRVYQKAFDFIMLMAIAMFVAVFILAPVIVAIIGGAEFIQSVVVLRILAVANFIAYFNHLTGFAIVALKKQRQYLLITISALFLNVVANLIMIPRFSYTGAALVTVMTEGFVQIATASMLWFYLKKTPKLWLFPKTALELIKNRGKFINSLQDRR